MSYKPVVFFVRGRGQFPFDMLRHDGCYPLDHEDAEKMAEGWQWRTVCLVAPHGRITPERWASFGWTLTMLEEGEPAPVEPRKEGHKPTALLRDRGPEYTVNRWQVTAPWGGKAFFDTKEEALHAIRLADIAYCEV